MAVSCRPHTHPLSIANTFLSQWRPREAQWPQIMVVSGRSRFSIRNHGTKPVGMWSGGPEYDDSIRPSAEQARSFVRTLMIVASLIGPVRFGDHCKCLLG